MFPADYPQNGPRAVSPLKRHSYAHRALRAPAGSILLLTTAATLMAMNPNQPSSVEGDTLFRAMESMLSRYAQRLAAGQSSCNSADIPGPSGVVSRNDAIAAAHQLAGYIAATSDPRVVPDPGAGAAFLMIMIEYIAPQPGDLEPGFKDALKAMVEALRNSSA
jgi:hypothetical protein